MFTRKRKSEEMYNNSSESEIVFLIQEIKNLLNEKNIIVTEEIIEKTKDINILLTDKKNNNNVIGKINGGVGEFFIIENGEEIEKDAFTITWLKVDSNYQGHNLATFLIIYSIYLCKKNFSYVQYIFLEDDTDEIDPSKNIYIKLGFTYQKKKETVQLEDGQFLSVNNGSEMQLNISDFFNSNLIEKLNKIKITIKNWNKNGGGKSKSKSNSKSNSKSKSKSKNKNKKIKKNKTKSKSR